MKNRRKTEWKISLIDEHGDIVDTTHEDTKKAAMNYAEGWCGKDGCNKVLVEKTIWYWKEDDDGDRHDCEGDFVCAGHYLVDGEWRY